MERRSEEHANTEDRSFMTPNSHAVVEEVFAAEADVVLRAVHVVLDRAEGDLGLNHPKLSEVTGGVGVLGAERWPKRVDITQGTGEDLALEMQECGRENKRGWRVGWGFSSSSALSFFPRLSGGGERAAPAAAQVGVRWRRKEEENHEERVPGAGPTR